MSKLNLIKPSDAKSWSLCHRRVWFDNNPPEGFVINLDPFDELIRETGIEHEKAILENLSKGRTVGSATSPQTTKVLMTEGIDIIYQAQFQDDMNGIVGNPDFLVKHPSGSYQPADAKLANTSKGKKDIQVQIGMYRRLLNTSLPGLVYLGNGGIEEIGEEIDEKVDSFISDMKQILKLQKPPNVRYSHSKCRACPYYNFCRPAFIDKSDLSLLYGINGRSVSHLEAAGIKTIEELAKTQVENIPDVPYLKENDKKHRAILQAQSWISGELIKLNTISLPQGTWVHFDVEDNPLEPTGEKHVYLWGFLKPNYTQDDFEYSWTDSMSEDRSGWLNFIKLIEKYQSNYPDLVIAHYTGHEITTIKQYAKRYQMENNPTVQWLLGNNSPLFDLQKPVLDNLILPLQGYGLKDICKHPDLVNFQWEDSESGSQWSVVQFNKFQKETDQMRRQELKRAILGYNRDDVFATRKLEEWLNEI